jgi:hypothetical protein
MKKLLFVMAVGATLFMACSKNEGCMDANATNYDASAEEDDGSCTYTDTSNTDTTTNTGGGTTDTTTTSGGTTDTTNTGTTTSTGNHVKFDGEQQFAIEAASANTYSHELDTSGRAISFSFYEKAEDESALDDNYAGDVIWIGVFGSKDSIGVFTGDYTNDNKWADGGDANTAPDYTFQSAEDSKDELDDSDKIPEVCSVTKSPSGEYEIKVKVEVYKGDKLGILEIYYKGTL